MGRRLAGVGVAVGLLVAACGGADTSVEGGAPVAAADEASPAAVADDICQSSRLLVEAAGPRLRAEDLADDAKDYWADIGALHNFGETAALLNAINALRDHQLEIRRTLRNDDPKDTLTLLDSTDTHLTEIDAAAAALGSHCTSTDFAGGWFDNAREVAEFAMSIPARTGDFIADVERACNTYREATAALIEPAADAPNTDWADHYQARAEALRQFATLLDDSTDPPTEQRQTRGAASTDLRGARSALLDVIEEYGTSRADERLAQANSRIADAISALDSTGASCR